MKNVNKLIPVFSIGLLLLSTFSPLHASTELADLNNQEAQRSASESAAIRAWEENRQTFYSMPSEKVSSPASGQYTRVSFYRGSYLLWARETVEFRWSNNRVTWSNGYQQSGAIFPNTITEKGTSRVYTSSWNHTWNGRYTVGAGVPTPWGNANVYHTTSVITTNVYGNGGHSGNWNN
ncbi:hypothetical protein QM007_10265 [Rothia sp. SD9660Na]|uniref:hypothetical protein n=1 Tax=Rothia sp. SD9660Na TaxID=3047030 RepID=UPI0024BB1737|nr:hypothetical protein [Rothia sp. SD9660Na]WHS50282.1 hypothetical protein QM007_10265 [Rothia sp. SD9660Na]